LSTLSTGPEAVPRTAPAGLVRRLRPAWSVGYRRDWLGADAVAGLVIWSVVTPQAVAYAQIAGLPPSAGLVAAPGAMLGYALVGNSRVLVVSATTATSAVSAAAVGPVAGGDAARFLTLSAAFALICALVLGCAGALRLGGVSDIVSKPVMTGFLFGLGLTIAVSQLPHLLGVPGGDGDAFRRLWAVLTQLGRVNGWTAAVGLGGIALLLVLRRVARGFPSTLAVLALAIVASVALDLASRGVDVVGDLSSAYPHPVWPSISFRDFVDLLPAAFGVLLVSTEAVGVARGLASADGDRIDANRELVALGSANLLAGLSSGFVQSGGASQTAAAREAGGRSQLASVVAAGLILLTGAFLTPLFEHLPEAALAAIVVVAISGFYRVDELRRFARIRTSAFAYALVALAGVLVLGVLPGLIVAAGLTLIDVVRRLSRPHVGLLARDPASGAWGRADRHPDWRVPDGVAVGRVSGPLLYANATNVKEQVLELVRDARPVPAALVLDLAQSPDLDLQALDTLGELERDLGKRGIELRLADVRTPAVELLRRSGLDRRVRVEPTVDAAVGGPRRP
jgi:high affinity sulfate transporter 1